jgi:hypothetical protein
MPVPLPSSPVTTYSLLAARCSRFIFTRLLGESDDGDVRGHLTLADKVLAPCDGRPVGPQILPLDGDPPQERRGAPAQAQELLGHARGDALVDVVSSHRGRTRWPASADWPAVPRPNRLIRPLLPQPGNVRLDTAINTSAGMSWGWGHGRRTSGGRRSGPALRDLFGLTQAFSLSRTPTLPNSHTDTLIPHPHPSPLTLTLTLTLTPHPSPLTPHPHPHPSPHTPHPSQLIHAGARRRARHRQPRANG